MIATPTVSPAADTYSPTQTVTISDATSGASIYYATDGTTYTTSSTKYGGPITVFSGETLEAIALESGHIISAVTVPTNTINPLGPSGSTSPTIDCRSGFASTGACGVGIIAGGKSFQLNGTTNGSSPALSGSQILLIPTGATHAALSLIYQTQVNVQAFTTNFTFVPNGQNIAFVIQNSNNNPAFNGAVFSAGAGGEAGFFQVYSQREPPNNVFAMELDSYSPLTESGSFTYSSVQIYRSGQCPALPTISPYPDIDKIRTSPVNLTTGSQNTTTGHTYSATVTYERTNLTLNLYDVTAGGSCPGPNCFIYTWNNVDIPPLVGGNTAWVGFTAATGLPSIAPLYVNSFVYAASQWNE
jgi:hypothetical protein